MILDPIGTEKQSKHGFRCKTLYKRNQTFWQSRHLHDMYVFLFRHIRRRVKHYPTSGSCRMYVHMVLEYIIPPPKD